MDVDRKTFMVSMPKQYVHDEESNGMTTFPSSDWIDSAATALSNDQQFARMSRAFDVTIRFDFGNTAYALTIDEGDVITVHENPIFVSWDFAVRAPESTWKEMLSETPPPKYHDLLAAWLRSDARIEGNLKTAIQHLQPLRRMIVVFRKVANE